LEKRIKIFFLKYSMDQRFVGKNIQQNIQKTTGMPSWKIEKTIKQMAKEGNVNAVKAKELWGENTQSIQGTRKLVGSLRKIGIIKNVGEEQMVNRIKEQAAAGEKPKLTIEDMRKQRGAMAKKMAGLYTHEREATSAGKPANATTAALRTTAKTSALTPKKVTGPRATTSALRSTSGSPAKPAVEEKPQAIDLAID
jgi:hypothetical protein